MMTMMIWTVCWRRDNLVQVTIKVVRRRRAPVTHLAVVMINWAKPICIYAALHERRATLISTPCVKGEGKQEVGRGRRGNASGLSAFSLLSRWPSHKWVPDSHQKLAPFKSPTYYYIIIINWFIKRRKVVSSEAPCLHRDGRNHFRYSLHPPTEGWPGWVGLSGLDKYHTIVKRRH